MVTRPWLAKVLLPPGLGESRAADARIEENERTAHMPFAPFTVALIRPSLSESCCCPTSFVRQKNPENMEKIKRLWRQWRNGRIIRHGNKKSDGQCCRKKGKVFFIFFKMHA